VHYPTALNRSFTTPASVTSSYCCGKSRSAARCDLCLACKGCKGDCPVSVDVATCKAEFLAHYYEGGTRPPAAYAMGVIDKWAKLASLWQISLHKHTASPPSRESSAASHRIATPRRFHRRPFKDWFAKRSSTLSSPMNIRGGVILWADTFNNYLFPHTSKAAVEVLEDAGFRVRVPQQHLYCGRSLYDFGILDEAKTNLRAVLKSLAPEIAAGTPIVCLEPSCTSVFHDELVNLFPNDEAAKKLQKQIILSLLSRERRLRPRSK
jgi:Fe-S oxidoreductase